MFFFLERELEKVMRDTLARAGMDSNPQRPGNFWLVRSEHAHASYPGLFVSPARVQPLYGAGRKESSGTGLPEAVRWCLATKCLLASMIFNAWIKKSMENAKRSSESGYACKLAKSFYWRLCLLHEASKKKHVVCSLVPRAFLRRVEEGRENCNNSHCT
mgnify:CR=1 FL=1